MKKRLSQSRKGEMTIATKSYIYIVLGALLTGTLLTTMSFVYPEVKSRVEMMGAAGETEDGIVQPTAQTPSTQPTEQEQVSDELWTIHGNTLTGYIGPITEGMTLVIPTEVQGHKVFKIENRDVNIKKGEQRLNIFNATETDGIQSIVIPNSVMVIGDAAFAGCKGVTKQLVIPDSVERIGAYAFANSTFTGNLVIPSSVKEIGDNAFAGCTSLNGTLTMPGTTMKTIGREAFLNCSLIGSLSIPTSVHTIYDAAFQNCKFNGTLTLGGNNLHTIGKYAFAGNHFTGDLSFPDSMKEIGDYSFENAGFTGVLKIQKDNLKIVGRGAFNFCHFTSIVEI